MADIKSHSTLTTNLVSYWDLEEASGTRYDLHGSNNLTDNNTVTQGTGKIGNCGDFELSNSEYLDIADNASVSITGDISFSMWLKFESIPSAVGLCNKITSANGGWRLQTQNSGEVYLRFFDSSGNESHCDTDSVVMGSVDTWYHLVVTADVSAGGAGIKIYVDGVDVTGTGNVVNNATSIGDTSEILSFGCINADSTPAWFMDGLMEEIGLWSKVLTSDEVTDLYNSGDGLPYYAPDDIKNDTTLSTSLVSFWELEEASGTRTDSHGSNDLTPNNTPGNATGKVGDGADFDTSVVEYVGITDGSQTGLEPASVSMFGWVYLNVASVGRYFGGKAYASTHISPYQSYSLATDGTAGNFAVQWAPGGTPTTTISTFPMTSTGTWYHVGFTYDGTTIKMYGNGVYVGGTTGSAISYSTGPFRLGGNASYSNSGYMMDGILDEVGVWSKALTDGEVRALYGYGTPPAYSSGTAYSLAVTVGAFTLTGNATLFNRTANMVASAGSFVLTGFSALFGLGKGIFASAGSFTLTGMDTSFKIAISMVASAGSFTLTGVNAVFNKGKTLIVSVGTFTLTGFPAFLRPSNIWTKITRNTTTWTKRNRN